MANFFVPLWFVVFLVGGVVSKEIDFEVSNGDGVEFFVTEEALEEENEESIQPTQEELQEILEEELEELEELIEIEEQIDEYLDLAEIQKLHEGSEVEAEKQQQQQQQEMEVAFENSLNDALNLFIEEEIVNEQQQQQQQQQLDAALDLFIEEQIFNERQRTQQQQQQQQQQQLDFQSYREIEQANDAEVVAFLNALMMSWFTEPLVPEVQGPTIVLSPVQSVEGRSSNVISGRAEIKTPREEQEEEEEEQIPNEEYCYQLPLEFEVECLTSLIQLLRDENEDLRAHPSVQATTHHTEHHYHHHHHNNSALIVGALCCVIIGVVIGRYFQKKRKPCKVHQYHVLPQKEGVNANSRVEVEEREFYPYYVAAKV